MKKEGSRIAQFIDSDYKRDKYWEQKVERIKEEKTKLDEHLRKPLIIEKEDK